MKSKAPAGPKTKEEKQKGLALFGQKPPTPKLLKAFGNFRKGGILDKLKVKSFCLEKLNFPYKKVFKLIFFGLLFTEKCRGAAIGSRPNC